MGMDIAWSPSRLGTANDCSMAYHLGYVEHYKQARIPAFPKGRCIHQVCENFHHRLGTRDECFTASGNRRTGRNAKAYWDAESFGKHLQGKWMSIVMGDFRLREKIEDGKYYGKELEKKRDNLITWRDEEEPYLIKWQMESIGRYLFDVLKEEGPPLFAELEFDFVLRNLYFEDSPESKFDLHFIGIIDDVRIKDGKVHIRDYKSGKPWINYSKVMYDPQLTLYNAGLCSLVLRDDEMADMLGLTERRNQYFKGGFIIDPDFSQEYFMVEAEPIADNMFKKNPKIKPERLPKASHLTSRTDAHFEEVVKTIYANEKILEEGIIRAERGRKCEFCSLQEACAEKLNDNGPYDKFGQGIMSFSQVIYEKTVGFDQERSVVTTPRKVMIDPPHRQYIINTNNKRGW